MSSSGFIAVAGITGALGNLIGSELVKRGAAVKGLVRPGTDPTRAEALRKGGIEVIPVDLGDVSALTAALKGATCVVSALQGLEDVIIDTQGRLLDAAVSAKVPRFIPSDFSLDFTKTAPGSNRNLDLRRSFQKRLEKSGIQWTSILNGAFMDLLDGEASPIDHQKRKVTYVGKPTQPWDWTTMHDIAAFTAAVATDTRKTPNHLRIAGDVAAPQDLAEAASKVYKATYKLSWMGSVGFLEWILIPILRLFGGRKELFPVWQQMQYAANMASGQGKLEPLDNSRYPDIRWTTLQAFFQERIQSNNRQGQQ